METTVSMNDVYEELVASYQGAIRRKKAPRSYILLGSPGVGKTQIIYKVAEAISADVEVVLSSTINVEDIVGFPEKVGNYADYLPFSWVKKITEKEYNKPVILFFDDLLLAHEQVQGAFFRIVLERYCGSRKIRDDVFICAASNRTDDAAGAQQFNTALKNRFRILNVHADTEQWIEWAQSAGIHPLVISYIQTHRNHLNQFDPETEDQTPTPRSWENVSDWLFERSIRNEISSKMIPFISGIIGQGVAASFVSWAKTAKGAIPPTKIISDPESAPIPDLSDIDILYVTIYSLGHYLNEHKKKDVLEAALKYIIREEMPKEFGFIILSQFASIISTFPPKEKIEMIQKSSVVKDVIKVYNNILPASLNI